MSRYIGFIVETLEQNEWLPKSLDFSRMNGMFVPLEVYGQQASLPAFSLSSNCATLSFIFSGIGLSLEDHHQFSHLGKTTLPRDMSSIAKTITSKTLDTGYGAPGYFKLKDFEKFDFIKTAEDWSEYVCSEDYHPLEKLTEQLDYNDRVLFWYF